MVVEANKVAAHNEPRLGFKVQSMHNIWFESRRMKAFPHDGLRIDAF